MSLATISLPWVDTFKLGQIGLAARTTWEAPASNRRGFFYSGQLRRLDSSLLKQCDNRGNGSPSLLDGVDKTANVKIDRGVAPVGKPLAD